MAAPSESYLLSKACRLWSLGCSNESSCLLYEGTLKVSHDIPIVHLHQTFESFLVNETADEMTTSIGKRNIEPAGMIANHVPRLDFLRINPSVWFGPRYRQSVGALDEQDRI